MLRLFHSLSFDAKLFKTQTSGSWAENLEGLGVEKFIFAGLKFFVAFVLPKQQLSNPLACEQPCQFSVERATLDHLIAYEQTKNSWGLQCWLMLLRDKAHPQ